MLHFLWCLHSKINRQGLQKGPLCESLGRPELLWIMSNYPTIFQIILMTWKVFSNHNDSMMLWFSLLIKCILFQETDSCDEKSRDMEEPSGVWNKNSWCHLSLWLAIFPHRGGADHIVVDKIQQLWNELSKKKKKNALRRIVAAGEALWDSPGPRGLKWGSKFASFKACSFKPFINPSAEQVTVLHFQPESSYSESKSSLWMEPPIPTCPGPPAQG